MNQEEFSKECDRILMNIVSKCNNEEKIFLSNMVETINTYCEKVYEAMAIFENDDYANIADDMYKVLKDGIEEEIEIL